MLSCMPCQGERRGLVVSTSLRCGYCNGSAGAAKSRGGAAPQQSTAGCSRFSERCTVNTSAVQCGRPAAGLLSSLQQKADPAQSSGNYPLPPQLAAQLGQNKTTTGNKSENLKKTGRPVFFDVTSMSSEKI